MFDRVSAVGMKARSWLKTSCSEREWEKGPTHWERESGIIPTARSPCHPANHNNMLQRLSSETLKGLGLARQLSTCWTSSSIIVKGTEHCGTGALVLCGGEVLQYLFYTHRDTGEGKKLIVWSHTMKQFYSRKRNLTSFIRNFVWLVLVGWGTARGGHWWLQNSLHKPKCHLRARLP